MRHPCRTITIGVSGHSAQSKSVRAMLQQIRDEGSVAVFLSAARCNLSALPEEDIAKIDALVLMGNNWDIDPKAYIGRYEKGDPKAVIHPKTRSEFSTPKGKMRARYEEAMLTKALARKMPVLGICGGMQRINVMMGGTLHQHIPDLVGCDKHMQHKQGIAPHIPIVPIIIKEHTTLAAIASDIRMSFVNGHSPLMPKVVMENSMHHQSVDKVASHLRACALTDSIRLRDGTAGYLVEAIETDPCGALNGQYILGVQWHPEFGASSLGEKIVRHLIAAAREFTRRRKKLTFRSVQSLQHIIL